MKPDYRSYFKRQFTRHPYIVKCYKTGQIFREINGETHRLIFRLLGTFIIFLVFAFILLSLRAIPRIDTYLFLLIYASIDVSLILITYLIFILISYKVSKFEIIDEGELVKYPGVIESLKKAELRSKKKKH